MNQNMNNSGGKEEDVVIKFHQPSPKGSEIQNRLVAKQSNFEDYKKKYDMKRHSVRSGNNEYNEEEGDKENCNENFNFFSMKFGEK